MIAAITISHILVEFRILKVSLHDLNARCALREINGNYLRKIVNSTDPFWDQLGESNVELAVSPRAAVTVRNCVRGEQGDGEDHHQRGTSKTPHPNNVPILCPGSRDDKPASRPGVRQGNITICAGKCKAINKGFYTINFQEV